MRIKLVKKMNPHRRFRFPRIIIDEIHVREDKVMIQLVFRKGRAFSLCDYDFNRKFNVLEEELTEAGLGDYRCSCLDKAGRMIIAGADRNAGVRVFSINPEGKRAMEKKIDAFPHLSSISADDAAYYLHSPEMDAPVCVFPKSSDKYMPLGRFPEDSGKITRKIGIVKFKAPDDGWMVYETSPPIVNRLESGASTWVEFERSGKLREIVEKSHPDRRPNVLDASVCPDSGRLFVLLNSPEKAERPLIIFTPGADVEQVAAAPKWSRKIAVGHKGVLFIGRVHFSVLGMLSTFSLYGAAITSVEKYVIEDL